MDPTTRADAGTAISTPAKASKMVYNASELDIARALKDGLLGQVLETDRPQTSTEDKAQDQGSPEPDKQDTPQNAEEEALSDSDIEPTDADSAEAEAEVVTDDAAESEEDSDAKRYSDRTKARIEKLAREKTEAKKLADEAAAKVSALEAKIVELQSAQQVQPKPDHGSLVNVWDEAKLAEEWNKARQLKRWCEDNESGATVGETDYTAAQVRDLKRNVEDALDIHIPQRMQFLQQHKALRPEIERIYPWTKDRNSAEYAEAQRLKALLPGLNVIPEHDVLIGDFLVGRKMRLESQKKASAPVRQAPKPAPKQPGLPKQSPARVDPKATVAKSAEQRFMKSQGERDLATLLKAKGFV
jgi:hypothetical protein